MRKFVALFVLLILTNAFADELIIHKLKITSLSPKIGSRVQIDVETKISRDQCSKFISKYKENAEPDGQVSVHMPSAILKGKLAPFCILNFDGKGVIFNDMFFQ